MLTVLALAERPFGRTVPWLGSLGPEGRGSILCVQSARNYRVRSLKQWKIDFVLGTGTVIDRASRYLSGVEDTRSRYKEVCGRF